jgi:cancer susceptibility candidate protein 1
LAIQDICFAVRSFFIKSSRWNHIINSEKIIVRLRENPEFDEDFAEDQEKDWKTFVWWKNKVGSIKMRDSYENLNENLLEGTLTHARLDLLLTKHNLIASDLVDRMKDTQYIVFNDTLKRFLKLTKLLSFTFE